jgi:hypothetical protein
MAGNSVESFTLSVLGDRVKSNALALVGDMWNDLFVWTPLA